MGGHGRDAHDVGDLALEPGLVVAGLGDESEHVLGDASLRRVNRVHNLAVPVPDNLGWWIATARLAGQLDLLTSTQRLALDVAFNERWSGFI